MANAVFANSREIACKAAAGKTICAMPDVCFTPPENPATPPGVPVPYPNTGMASDTTEGSKKVKISDKEVGLKNKSSFKKSMGDEAGAAAKKGVVTSKNTGKVFFNAWSMDVKIEGQNAVRHLDLTTNNHASMPGDTPPWPYIDSMAVPPIDEEVGEVLCDCCGKPAHTEMQAQGEELSEEEFYCPDPKSVPKGETLPSELLRSKEILAKIRSGPCKNLLPPENPKPATKCNKYYVADRDEQSRIESDWDAYRDTYYKKFKVLKGTSIAHRVPKQAGGCPTGPGNLMPQPEGCSEAEAELTNLQNKATRYHRRMRGMI
jgi:hypothetical protein